jgi:hypothetical protein
VIGEAAGITAIAGVGPLASDLLYGVSPRDPVVLGSIGIFLLIVSTLAALKPAFTSAGADPQISLKTA